MRRGWSANIVFAAPHGVDRPVLIDATVEQGGGAQLHAGAAAVDATGWSSPTSCLSRASLPGEQAAARLDAYVRARGWQRGSEGEHVAGPGRCRMAAISRPSGGSAGRGWRSSACAAASSIRVTGRTLGDAAANAMLLARQQDFSGAALHDLFEAEARRPLARPRVPARGQPQPRRREDRAAKLAALFALDPGLITRFHADKLGMFERMKVQRAVAGG